MKKAILILSLGMLMSACWGNSNNKGGAMAETTVESTATAADAHNAKNSLDVKGIYQGMEGMNEVSMTLADSTFNRVEVTPGKDSQTIVNEGSYKWDETGNIIHLTGSNGNHMYFVGENTLTQLDEAGNKVTGIDNNFHVLRKEIDAREETKK